MLHLEKVIALFALMLAGVPIVCSTAIAAPGDAIIIIANKTYRYGIAPVEFADRDAEAMEKAAREVLGIERPGIKRFDDMTGREAWSWFHADGTTGSDLHAFLRRTLSRREGTVYFYYSGHGVTARNAIRNTDELHFVLHDTGTDAGKNGLSVEAVRQALIRAQMDIAPAGRVILLLDACFSGFGRDGKEIFKGARTGVVPAELAPLPSVVVLAAAGPAEPAWSDLNRKHGAFTDALLDGLYGDAADDKRRVTADRLRDFIERRVATRLRDQAEAARHQTPILRGDGATVLVSLKSPLPEREPDRRVRVELRCQTVSASNDIAMMRNFLRSECDEKCPCRSAVEGKISSIEVAEARCRLERDELAELKTRRPPARAAMEELHRISQCPAVKADVVKWIETERHCRREIEEVEQSRLKGEDGRHRLEELKGSAGCPETRVAAAEALDRLPKRFGFIHPPPPIAHPPSPDPARSVVPGTGRGFRDHLDHGSECAHCPELLVVPAGKFKMGSPPNEVGRDKNEGPQREVTIARPFAIGRFEVTFAEWDACRASGACGGHQPDDKGWGREKRPVINVSWGDAKDYASWLSRITGRAYRLPSEAEWEYAARAGATTAYAFGDTLTTKQARFSPGKWGSAGSTLPVGSFPPNRWGLHDMHGNIWEWVEDCWNDSYSSAPIDGSAFAVADCTQRIARGGSWYSSDIRPDVRPPRFDDHGMPQFDDFVPAGPGPLRSASRFPFKADHRNHNVGFRLVRALDH